MSFSNKLRHTEINVPLFICTIICLYIISIYCSARFVSHERELAIIPGSMDYGMDFVQCHVAAKSFLAGHHIYTDNSHHGPEFTDPYHFEPTRFVYPPAAVFLFLPATIFQWKTAYWIWACLQMMIVAGVCFFTARRAKISRPSASAVTILSCLSYPVLFSVQRGNFDTMILLIYWAGIMTWIRKGPNYNTGVLIGAATALKLFPAMVIGYLFVRRDFQTWGKCVVGGGIITAIFGGYLLPDFVKIMVAVTSLYADNSLGIYNHSLVVFMLRSFASLGWLAEHNIDIAQKIAKAMMGIILVALSVTVFRWQNRSKLCKHLEVCAFLLLMTIIPSISYDYKLVFIAYLLPVFVAGAIKLEAHGQSRFPMIIGALCIAHAMTATWQFANARASLLHVIWASKTPAILLLIVIFIWMISLARKCEALPAPSAEPPSTPEPAPIS